MVYLKLATGLLGLRQTGAIPGPLTVPRRLAIPGTTTCETPLFQLERCPSSYRPGQRTTVGCELLKNVLGVPDAQRGIFPQIPPADDARTKPKVVVIPSTEGGVISKVRGSRPHVGRGIHQHEHLPPKGTQLPQGKGAAPVPAPQPHPPRGHARHFRPSEGGR